MRSGSALQLMPAVRATATDQSRSGALRVEPTAVAASVALRSLGSGRVWRVLWRDKGIACPTIFLAGCGATGADVNSASCVCRASAAKTRPPWLEMRSRGLRLAPVSAKGLRTPYVRRGDPIGPLTGGSADRSGLGPCQLRDPLVRRACLPAQGEAAASEDDLCVRAPRPGKDDRNVPGRAWLPHARQRLGLAPRSTHKGGARLRGRRSSRLLARRSAG